jgi:hypothetical protein
MKANILVLGAKQVGKKSCVSRILYGEIDKVKGNFAEEKCTKATLSFTICNNLEGIDINSFQGIIYIFSLQEESSLSYVLNYCINLPYIILGNKADAGYFFNLPYDEYYTVSALMNYGFKNPVNLLLNNISFNVEIKVLFFGDKCTELSSLICFNIKTDKYNIKLVPVDDLEKEHEVAIISQLSQSTNLLTCLINIYAEKKCTCKYFTMKELTFDASNKLIIHILEGYLGEIITIL